MRKHAFVCRYVAPLLSVITTLYYVEIIFHRRAWYRVLSLHYACIRSPGIIFIPWATFVPNFISFAAFVAELAHGEKLHTQSLIQLIWCPGNRSASENLSHTEEGKVVQRSTSYINDHVSYGHRQWKCTGVHTGKHTVHVNLQCCRCCQLFCISRGMQLAT